MTYLKRFGLASFSAFVVLVSYTVALKLPSQLNVDVLLAILLGALACCLVAGVASAALVRKNAVAMVIASQVLSIALIGVGWRL